MINLEFILKFFDKNFIVKLFLLALLYTIFPICEVVLLFFVGEILGKYLLFAIMASTRLIGVLIGLTQARKILTKLKATIKKGDYPESDFIALAGILAGQLFLIFPGFITDFFGFLMFLPFMRNAAGRFVTKRMEKTLNNVYEYLKLY